MLPHFAVTHTPNPVSNLVDDTYVQDQPCIYVSSLRDGIFPTWNRWRRRRHFSRPPPRSLTYLLFFFLRGGRRMQQRSGRRRRRHIAPSQGARGKATRLLRAALIAPLRRRFVRWMVWRTDDGETPARESSKWFPGCMSERTIGTLWC